MRRLLVAIAVVAGFFAVSAEDVFAKPRTNRQTRNAKLTKVCPRIIDLNPRIHFYKNNKPIRAGSAVTAPVIGQNPVMTFAYDKGQKGPLPSATNMYDSAGNILASMRQFPCRPDHCGGRVVSTVLTQIARRAAVRATRSPSGFIKLSPKLCVKVLDIGRCYGFAVNTGRPLCDRTLT